MEKNLSSKTVSYSQSGKDLIVDFIFKCSGMDKPSYPGIGTHDPFYLSNMARFYQKGCNGINIEANPLLIKNFYKYRKRDININCGMGNIDTEQKFYILSPNTMSAFSEEQAMELCEVCF